MTPIYRRIGKYKYILIAPYRKQVGIFGYTIKTQYIELSEDGMLTIKEWYAWNGANVVLDKHAIEGSLVHDALYQLIREKLLCRCHRPQADRLYRTMLLENGALPFRARLHYWGLRMVWTPCDALMHRRCTENAQ